MDSIAKNRAVAAERAHDKQRAKNSSTALQSVKQNKDPGALKAFDQASSEIEVAHSELQRYLINSALEMFQRETNSLTKAFEMTNLKIQAFIHPVQQFASTLDQEVDNRNHLDLITKVGPIQKMLTQIKNRSLEIETLTSGAGVVISRKDLNECLEECCRALIKSGEVEMKNRCDHLCMMAEQLEHQLYVKDR